MNTDLLATALALRAAGVSIVPIDHRTKKPKGAWKHFQTAIASEAEVRRWIERGGAKAIAAVGGAVSGGLLMLDFDEAEFFNRWRDAVGGVPEGAFLQRTGGGGYQLWFRCERPGGSTKLAWVPNEAEESGRSVAIETRGEGGYALIAPSLHPTGHRYERLSGDAANLPIIPQDHADKLLAAARSLDQAPHTRQELEARARQSHRESHVNQNGQADVIGAFNKKHSIESVLKDAGYKQHANGRLIRPGGKNGTVSTKDGRSCHWASNDQLNDGKHDSGCGIHDAFSVWAHFHHRGDVTAAVKAAAEMLGMKYEPKKKKESPAAAAEEWPDLLPLPKGLPAVMALSVELLPTRYRNWIRDIADRMQCPHDYPAAAGMIVAAALVGRKIAIRPERHDDWTVVCNLYGMLIGRPSLMKTPAMQEVTKLMDRLEIEAKADYEKAVAEHSAAELVGEAKAKIAKEKIKQAIKSGRDAQAVAVELLADVQDKPTRRRYRVTDVTMEKLGEILAENPNGVLAFFDELIRFLKSMEREGHESDRGFYLTAWSGDSRYTYDRIGRGTTDIAAACVSILGSTQPGVISEYLRAAVGGGRGDDGLIQRFQVTVWPDSPATWKNVDRYPNSVVRDAAYAQLRKIADLNPSDIGAERDALDANAIPFLRFTDDAQAAFDGWRSELENRLRSGVEHPAIESHLAKYRSLIPSLSLICHLLDDGCGPVPLSAIQRAIGWGQYLESHARRLYASVTDAPAVAARLLAARIQSGDIPSEFAARDVYRMGWTGLDREQTTAATDVLLSLHWIQEKVEPTAGRDRTRYVASPKIEYSYGNPLTKPTKAPSVGFVSTSPGVNEEFADYEQAEREAIQAENEITP